MGKTGGFLEFDRINNEAIEPLDRISNFDEFHTPLPKAIRMKQAARCMDCGVPFCQSGMILNGMATGCPLHNLIPEWNDMVYHDHLDVAFERLSKTNNFPEFTSRVCPALCEKACTCGLNGESVTVRDNEYAIIEYAYEKGLRQPLSDIVRTGKKVAIIGSGPSGLALGDELNKRGHDVTIFEKDDRFGGLLMYGIPNMKLDKKVVEKRLDIMRQEGVKFVGNKHINDKDMASNLLVEYDAIALACGSRKARNIIVEGREGKGIEFALDFLTANTKALLNNEESMISAKDKKVLVIGGGDTGNDCIGTSIRQGCSSIIQLEMMPKPPMERAQGNEWPQWPKVLKTDYGQEEAIACFGKDPRLFQTTVKRFINDEAGHVKQVEIVSLAFEKDETSGRMKMSEVSGSEQIFDIDLVLIAAGFVGCEDDVVDAFEIKCERGRVICDNYYTSQDKVFALGDMRRGQSLVVWGIAEGRACAKAMDEYLMGYTNL